MLPSWTPTQESVFSTGAKGIMESYMSRCNGTIFAYGQTGSEKTYTIMRPSEYDHFSHHLREVIPPSFEYLCFLTDYEKDKAGVGKSFLCKCSFVDLQWADLWPTGVCVGWTVHKGVCKEGSLRWWWSRWWSQRLEPIVQHKGWRNRHVALTSMKTESPVISYILCHYSRLDEEKQWDYEYTNLPAQSGGLSRISRRRDPCRRDEGEGSRWYTLIIELLGPSDCHPCQCGKQRHVCSRDSKLTFLLRKSLGGNARTATVANIHPGSRCFGETLAVLTFPQRATLMKNKAEDIQVNVSQLWAEVKRLTECLAQLSSGQILPESFLIREKEETDYMKYFQGFYENL